MTYFVYEKSKSNIYTKENFMLKMTTKEKPEKKLQEIFNRNNVSWKVSNFIISTKKLHEGKIELAD